MDFDKILAVADYERPRTSEELSEWWLEKHHLFAATKEGKIYCRNGRGLSKKFYEEAQPMRTFMNAYFAGSDMRCRLDAGTGAADAVLLDKNGSAAKQIQITYAIDGYTEHLRMQQLTRAGSVDVLTRPIIHGSGRSKAVVFPIGRYTAHNDTVSEMIQMIHDRIRNKSAKRYTPGFALLVAFSDRSLDAEDTCEFRKAFDVLKHSFAELFLIGIHGKILVPERQ